jgi:hypothetical protein
LRVDYNQERSENAFRGQISAFSTRIGTPKALSGVNCWEGYSSPRKGFVEEAVIRYIGHRCIIGCTVMQTFRPISVEHMTVIKYNRTLLKEEEVEHMDMHGDQVDNDSAIAARCNAGLH